MNKARITRNTPAAIVVLIDQSGSMSEKINHHGTIKTKAQALAEIVDMMLSELLLRCKVEGAYRDYFDIAVLSYSGSGVNSMLTPSIVAPFISISNLAESFICRCNLSRERVLPSGKTIISTIEQKRWIEPASNGNTPMFKALNTTFDMLSAWLLAHRRENHIAPMVFNISDGEASDASYAQLEDVAQKIKSLGSPEQQTKLFNIHLASESEQNVLMFPCNKDNLSTHKYAELLYDMSSSLPDEYTSYIESITLAKATGSFRGVCYNTDMNKLLGILNIGSASINLL
ncbi:MAG: vWA domain-containing protein [Rikenellaceae bacterium]